MVIIQGGNKGLFRPVNFRISCQRESGEDCCSWSFGNEDFYQLLFRDKFDFVIFEIEKGVIRYAEERMDKQGIQE